MVQDQLRDRGIRDERVLTAMTEVPREQFLDADHQSRAYADEAVPIDAGQTISQPWVVARMTELLAPQPGERVLELGTGSGYQAAILAALGADVTSLERHAVLASTGARSDRSARVAGHGHDPDDRRQPRRSGRRDRGTGSSSRRPPRPSRRSSGSSWRRAVASSSRSGLATIRS